MPVAGQIYTNPRVKKLEDGSHELTAGDRFIASWAPGDLDLRRVNSMLVEAFEEGRRVKAEQIRFALGIPSTRRGE